VVTIGWLAGFLIAIAWGATRASNPRLSSSLSGWAIAGLVVCSAIGIGFGLYPAYRAASLDPIDALRYE